ncbi:MAG: sensor histidine kinase, partial [Lachnospiraceae bacterium]|nr:sensor histidine kinase [Lachnospiraceae bacterium]
NTIKYRDEEKVLEISVSANKVKDKTELIYEDNGTGISKEDLPRIFEKSFTGSNGRETQKSTGMGLYIVKNLCDRLGHTIRAESEKGKYTRFTITFADNDYYCR